MNRLTHYILLGAAAAGLLSGLPSCSDEEAFTTDRGAVVAFSSDTVSFDTLFTGVSSATERLMVYNHNGKGLRISNARLRSNGASGFKMNIDGQFGPSLDGLEVLADDSIFVFLEVNVPHQAEDTPTLVSDEIVFTLESGVQQTVALKAYGQNAQTLRAERIEADRTIDRSLPCLVYDSLVVASGATLTLTEGASLYFHSGASLVVHGALDIQGTAEAPVTLRGDRLDRLFTYLPYDRLDNQWGGVRLTPTCTLCHIQHADIHSGNYGILADHPGGEVSIQNSVIHNVAGEGLCLKACQAQVVNTQISNARGNCVSIYGGKADFYHCTVAQFYPWSSDRAHALYVSNYLDDEECLVEGASFCNCLVTGYADDEVFGNPGEQALNLRFDGCLLLTDVSDPTYFTNCTADKKDAPSYKDTHFRTVDTRNYIYDFHLAGQSTARGTGQAAYSALYPTDHDGLPRTDTPDAGCYQFQ